MKQGRHPFGDKLRRQANILSGEYDISELSANVTSHCLIEKMLSIDPLERPPARAILKHPIFWQTEKVLAFFQDVSDRVEKDSSDSVVLQSLERSAYDVVRGNWKLHIDEIVMKDLQRHRNYQSRSVRDLLRALRNKVTLINSFSFQQHHCYFFSVAYEEKPLPGSNCGGPQDYGRKSTRVLLFLD